MKKIISFYLPQYYEFKENNEWWGKGFTEWTNVKKAKPLYVGHYQPTIPYHNYFYSLDSKETIMWQIKLAKEHGIYGFCFYHYWFGNGRKLMEKPVEMFLNDLRLDIPFCLCWANHNWTRTWIGGDTDILMEVKYGGEDAYREHFEYLLPYFTDARYIKKDNKPIFLIYMPELIPNLALMKTLFDKWCKEEGLAGIYFVSQAPIAAINRDKYRQSIDYSILYEPNYTQQYVTMCLKTGKIINAFKESPSNTISVVKNALKKRANKLLFAGKIDKMRLTNFSYDGTWKAIIKRKIRGKEYWPGIFMGYDNTPRKGYGGTVYRNGSPDKFKKYLKKFMSNIHDSDCYIFCMAWNEWGEGAYLEPDQVHGLQYLEAIKHTVK